jgi:hypothetical protein
MRGDSFGNRAVLLIAIVGLTLGAFQVTGAQQGIPTDISEHSLTYSRGEAVLPVYHGWHPHPDGTVDLWFGYLNQNWREEPDIPVGPDNFISGPYGPDAGQPTHFLPRNNRLIFKITVPQDFPEKEVVWTLTSNGKTYRAYATLHPGYVKDTYGIQREYWGSPPPEGNEAPEVQVDGDMIRTVKVGEASVLRVTVTDDGIPRPGRGGGDGDDGPPRPTAGGNVPQTPRASICGEDRRQFFCGEPNEGAGSLFSVRGLRMQCFLHRGDPDTEREGDLGHASSVVFDPPQAKAWEDHRGGSPWAPGYILPPLPPDNTWVINTTFTQPGSYVVRCQGHDGLLATNSDITFNVVP